MPCVFASGLLKSRPNWLSAPIKPDMTPWSKPKSRKAWHEHAVMAHRKALPLRPPVVSRKPIVW